MNKLINTLGIAIVASKYAAVILIAGLTITTGAVSAESMMLANFEGGD